MFSNLKDPFGTGGCTLLFIDELRSIIWLIAFSLLTSSCQLFADPDKVYTDVEIMPQPQSGFQAFRSYVTQNLVYPEEAIKQGISGKVLVQFVVKEDGSITQVEVIESLGFGCDQESIRVISESGPWEPGRMDGQPVKVRLVLPIDFVADSNS